MNVRAIHTAEVKSSIGESYTALRTYFSRSRLIPFLIVSMFAGLMGYTEYVTMEAALEQKIGEPPDWMDALMVIQFVAGYCGQLMVWGVCAAVVHLMAVIFDGDGKFADIFFFWGYGYIPLTITAIVAFNVLSASVDTVVVMALSADQQAKLIPGMKAVQLLGQAGLLALAAWGTYSTVRIHHLTVIKSFLCLAVPFLSLLILKLLFQTMF
jgi:hypothetical protein